MLQKSDSSMSGNMSQGYCSQSQHFLGSRDNDVILSGDTLLAPLSNKKRFTL